MASSYQVPKGIIETTYEIKKSRFVTRLFSVTSREQAMNALDLARNEYPDARHHCWAYQIGHPNSPELVAMSDDGEPSGTAGKPILNVMQHKDIGDAMIIVIRYFGGIKLGAGGLVRAYSQATQQAYDEGETELKVELDEFHIQCDFADEQGLRHWLSQHNGSVTSIEYAQVVSINIAMDEHWLSDLEAFLNTLKSAKLIKS